MSEITICPQCKTKLNLPRELIGKMARCPTCREAFKTAVAPQDKKALPRQPAEPRRRLPRFDDGDGFSQRARTGIDGLHENYSIHLGDWFAHAAENYTAVLGQMVLYSALTWITLLAVTGTVYVVTNSLTNPLFAFIMALFSFALLQPPLLGGFYAISLAQLQGEEWSFATCFAGFRYWGHLFFANVFIGLINGLLNYGRTLAIVLGLKAGFLPVPFVLIAPTLVFSLLNAYIALRLGFFAVPLIVHRNCGPIKALQGSWILSHGHFWGLFGSSLVIGLVALSGLVLLIVGFLFTVPFALLTISAGYLAIVDPRALRRGRKRRARAQEQTEDYDEEEEE